MRNTESKITNGPGPICGFISKNIHKTIIGPQPDCNLTVIQSIKTDPFFNERHKHFFFFLETI